MPIFSLPSASGVSGALPGVVQSLQSKGLAGRYCPIIPPPSGLDHTHSPAIRSEPDRRQREHGPALQCVAFKLPCGQTAAGYRWDANTHSCMQDRGAQKRKHTFHLVKHWICVFRAMWDGQCEQGRLHSSDARCADGRWDPRWSGGDPTTVETGWHQCMLQTGIYIYLHRHTSSPEFIDSNDFLCCLLLFERKLCFRLSKSGSLINPLGKLGHVRNFFLFTSGSLNRNRSKHQLFCLDSKAKLSATKQNVLSASSSSITLSLTLDPAAPFIYLSLYLPLIPALLLF